MRGHWGKPTFQSSKSVTLGQLLSVGVPSTLDFEQEGNGDRGCADGGRWRVRLSHDIAGPRFRFSSIRRVSRFKSTRVKSIWELTAVSLVYTAMKYVINLRQMRALCR